MTKEDKFVRAFRRICRNNSRSKQTKEFRAADQRNYLALYVQATRYRT